MTASGTYSIAYLTFALAVVFLKQNLLVNADYMPVIFWDPRNPLFNCPSRDVNTVHVKMGDYLTFLCPVRYSNLGLQVNKVNYVNLYEVAYFVHPEKKQDALSCNATGYTPFLKCDQTQKMWGLTVRVAQVQGDPSAPIFDYGKTYYVIGTGDGLQSGVNNQVGGRCNNIYTTPEKTYKMIMKIRVCTNDEVHVYKNCTICKTIGCYNKGCGNYNGWEGWESYRNITNIAASAANNGLSKITNVVPEENQCFRERRRNCDDDVAGCNGPSEQREARTCPKIKVSVNYQNCSSWTAMPDIYRNDTNHCFRRSYQNCTVGNLEKMDVTKWKMEKTNCPNKPVLCEEWSRSNSTFTNSSGHCFALLTRNCTLPLCTTSSIIERKLVQFACPTTVQAAATSVLSTSVLSTSVMSSSALPSSTISTTILPTSFVSTSSLTSSSSNSRLASSFVLSTESIVARKSTDRCSTVFSRLPCSPLTTPSPTPTDGEWSAWQDCNVKDTKFRCRFCTKPYPKNGGENCVGDQFKEMKCIAKCDPKAGQVTGNNVEENYKSYVFPIVAAVLGIASGCIATLFIVNHKRKVHNREPSSKNYEPDTDECVDEGITNNGFELGTIEKKKPPISQA